MSSIISAISGHFGKSLILGTFLPALLFIVLSVLFLLPLFPYDWQVLQQLEDGETRGVVVVSFVTVVLTGLLYNMNIPIIRFYEGYTWEHSWLGRLRSEHYQRTLKAASELRPRLQDVQGAMPALIKQEGDDDVREARRRLDQELRVARRESAEIVLKQFPDSGSVLPTQLGNLIRSFETYPRRQYGMSAITLWPRLSAKIDKDYAQGIDGAKTSFDFMINCSLLSFVLATLLLLVGLWYPIMFSAPRFWLPWLLKVTGFFALSHAFYRSSIDRASEWGETVKGAFDLYRHDLLTQLGYKDVPPSIEAERSLWVSISQQLIFGDARREPNLPPFKEGTTCAQCDPETMRLKLTRGVRRANEEDPYEVTLRVLNSDEYGRDAKRVVLTDALPEGFAYVWDSVSISADAGAGAQAYGGAEMLSGTDRMRFDLGTLAVGMSVTVRYKAVKYAGGDAGAKKPAVAGQDASGSDGAAKTRAEVKHE